MIRTLVRRVKIAAHAPTQACLRDLLPSKQVAFLAKRTQNKQELDKKLSQFEKESLQGIYFVNDQDKFVEPAKAKKESQKIHPIDSASSNSTMKQHFSKAKALDMEMLDEENDVTSSKFGSIQDRLEYLQPLHEQPKKKRAPILPKLKKKMAEMLLNTKKYFRALVHLDGQYLEERTAHFLINNTKRIKRGVGLLVHQGSKLYNSMKMFKDDIKFSIQTRRGQQKYDIASIGTQKKLQQVQRDVYKFIPFSIFIIIPGLELLLPAWLVIFPNAIPSQFKSPKAQEQQYYLKLQQRLIAADKLLKAIPAHLEKIAKDKEVPRTTRKEIKEILAFFREDGSLPTDLLKFKQTFRVYLGFKHWETKSLLNFSEFLGLTPVTGLNTINNLLGKLRLKIRIDNILVRWFTKPLITRQLKMYFRKLRKEDIIISYENLQELEEQQIDFLCIERGIQVIGRTKQEKIKNLKVWLSISNLNNVPDVLLLLAMIVDFAEDAFQATQSEQDYETVRRSESQIYFKEKFKAFEKAFGIEMLSALEAKISQRQRDLFMGKLRKNIIEENEIEDFFMLLDDFKKRHSLLSQKIEETYQKGYKFLDMLEKQLILEMVLNGRGEELEKKSPDLARKAKSFLGEKFYYSAQEEIDWEKEARIIEEKLENLNDNYLAFKNKKLINFRAVARRGSIPKTLAEMREEPVLLQEREVVLSESEQLNR